MMVCMLMGQIVRRVDDSGAWVEMHDRDARVASAGRFFRNVHTGKGVWQLPPNT